jgi:hypothetical protein
MEGLKFFSLLCEELSQEFKKNFQLCVRLKTFSIGTNNLKQSKAISFILGVT